MHWVWNGLQVPLGFQVSGYQLADPVVGANVTGPAWLTGGTYGPEGGAIGIAVRLLMILALVHLVRGRTGPWTVAGSARPVEPQPTDTETSRCPDPPQPDP